MMGHPKILVPQVSLVLASCLCAVNLVDVTHMMVEDVEGAS